MTKLKKIHTTILSLIAHVLPDSIYYPKFIKIKITHLADLSFLPTPIQQNASQNLLIINSIKTLVPKLPSYIKDTTHFLQKLDSLPELPNGCLLVILDVSSPYTNIPHKEGIHACKKPSNHVPTLALKLNPYVT